MEIERITVDSDERRIEAYLKDGFHNDLHHVLDQFRARHYRLGFAFAAMMQHDCATSAGSRVRWQSTRYPYCVFLHQRARQTMLSARLPVAMITRASYQTKTVQNTPSSSSSVPHASETVPPRVNN